MTHPRLRLLLVSSLALTSIASAADTAYPTCANGDTRTAVPVWQPEISNDSYITTEPEQKAGELVYIRATYSPSPDLPCNDETLHPLARRNTDGTPGGLSVNVKGNTTASDGACTFDGFYRNEDVPGMHQGWIETYFGAVPRSEVPVERYCLTQAVD